MIANASSHNAPAFSARFDRGIVNVEGGSVRHLVLTVRAPDVPRTDGPRLPLNLGLVIDVSGSMAGAPLDAAKAATLSLLDKLAATDHFSLVSFADDMVCHVDATRLDGPGRGGIAAAVRPLVTRGSTNLFAGWVGGCEAVAKRQAAAEVRERNHVILLSDGHANRGETDPARLAHHAGELRTRGVLTSTVGIGDGYSPIQLQAISEAGGGRMHDAELPEEIAEIMFAELTDALATTVENLEFRLQLPPGVEAEVYGTAPLNRDAEGCEILLGSLVGGSTRRLVVKLTFPARDHGERLSIEVSARWKSPAGDVACTAQVDSPSVRFDVPAACVSQQRCVDLARIVAEQWQSHIYHRGMMLNQDGQYAAAHEFVERESGYFAAYCEGLPELRGVVRDLHTFSPVVAHRVGLASSKELLFHSYKLNRGERDHRSRRRRTMGEVIADEAARHRGTP
jgi:Ca-activated chloride channel homolog